MKARDTFVIGMPTKHDWAQQFSIAPVAEATDVALGLLALPQQLLRRFDGPQYRRVAGAVAIDANSELDLVRPRIGIGHGDQREQRIALHITQSIEELSAPVGARHGRL